MRVPLNLRVVGKADRQRCMAVLVPRLETAARGGATLFCKSPETLELAAPAEHGRS